MKQYLAGQVRQLSIASLCFESLPTRSLLTGSLPTGSLLTRSLLTESLPTGSLLTRSLLTESLPIGFLFTLLELPFTDDFSKGSLYLFVASAWELLANLGWKDLKHYCTSTQDMLFAGRWIHTRSGSGFPGTVLYSGKFAIYFAGPAWTTTV
jgi:hypothetical protein